MLVGNVIRKVRGAGTVSGNDGQTFLEKIWRQTKFFFSLPHPGSVTWMGKDPPAIIETKANSTSLGGAYRRRAYSAAVE